MVIIQMVIYLRIPSKLSFFLINFWLIIDFSDELFKFVMLHGTESVSV